MDLDLLKTTLADAGEPAYRARQVWEWQARGVRGWDDDDQPARRRCATRLAARRAVLDADAASTRRPRSTAPSRRSSRPPTGARSRPC